MKNIAYTIVARISLLSLLLMFALNSPAQKLSTEEIVEKHLASVAPTEMRSKFNSFIAVGDVGVSFVAPKNPSTRGRIVFASSGDKSFVGMNLNAVDYRSEKFVYDGQNVDVEVVRLGSRSTLGNFITSNSALISDGLIGGVLSTRWAMAKFSDRRAKISSGGSKKINGADTFVLRYTPSGGGSLDINLYFDKSTFRHVRTEYSRISSASIGRTADDSVRQSESRLKLVEDFSDFKDVNGMTLPHSYLITYVISGAHGTTEIKWSSQLLEFAINQPLDDTTFRISGN